MASKIGLHRLVFAIALDRSARSRAISSHNCVIRHRTGITGDGHCRMLAKNSVLGQCVGGTATGLAADVQASQARVTCRGC